MSYLTVGEENSGPIDPVLRRPRLRAPSLPFPNTDQRLSGLIKDMRLVVIEGGPHAIAWTHADQANRALLDFLG